MATITRIAHEIDKLAIVHMLGTNTPRCRRTWAIVLRLSLWPWPADRLAYALAGRLIERWVIGTLRRGTVRQIQQMHAALTVYPSLFRHILAAIDALGPAQEWVINRNRRSY